MRLFTLVLVALLFCCAGLFSAPPQFVVENRTTPTPVFEVVNKTTPKLHPPGRGTAASPFAGCPCGGQCPCTGRFNCGCGMDTRHATPPTTPGTSVPYAVGRSTFSPVTAQFPAHTYTLAPRVIGGGTRYVQQCSGGTCRMVPVYP